MVIPRDNKDSIASMRQELGTLTKALNGLESALGGGVAGIEKDIADLYNALSANLSRLYFNLWPTEAGHRMYSFESKANPDKIIEEWRAVYRIANFLAKEDWICDGARMQPHLMWTKVGFIKARYHLNKLLVSFGLEDSANSSRNEVDAHMSRVKNSYLEELQEMERRMASPPKPTSKTSEDKLVQTEVEFKTTEVECKDQATSCELAEVEYIDQATSCELGKDELRDANAEIETLKLEKTERLKEEQNWADAEQIYQEVIKLKRDGQVPRAADDAAILDLRYQLAEMQMKQKKYSDAEATASDVWEKRRHPPEEEDSSATRSSRWQLCRALRGQGIEWKSKKAITMYREIWCYSTDKHWKMKNGHELGLALAEQGRLREAYVQHEEVWQERKIVLGVGEVDTVSSLQESLSILERQERLDAVNTQKEDPDIIILQKEKILRHIWEARGGPAEGFFDIPARGHTLGSLLFDQRRFDDAAHILNDVWLARKSGKSGLSEALSTGGLLAQAHESRRKLEEAEMVYRWICDTQENMLPPEDSRLLSARQSLGHVLFERHLFNDSVAECRKVWAVERRFSPGSVPDTVLNAGLDLALSLEQLGNFEEAYGIIALVCERKTRQLDPEPLQDTHSFRMALRSIQQNRPEIGPRPSSRPSTSNPPIQPSKRRRHRDHRADADLAPRRRPSSPR